MTNTLTTGSATWVDPGCGCCQPPAPPTIAEQVRALEARRQEMARRLAALQEGRP
ncbi:MAG: hypothetical protein ACRD0N_15590 [Acidimicrobiales bacterium]